MRIVYVGQIYQGSTCLHRLKAMRELGHDLTPVNESTFLRPLGRVLEHARFRLALGPGIASFNHAVLATAQEIKPDCVWIDKGISVWPKTVRRLHEMTKVVHYNPDDPFGQYKLGWRLFMKALPEYDLHFVPRLINVHEYQAVGAERVMRYFFAYDP